MQRFFWLSLGLLLCLSPVWYFLAPWLGAPVFYLAGEGMGTLFHWVSGYTRVGTSATLITTLKFVAEQGGARSGLLAPVVDYRLHGYGMALMWATLLAARPQGLARKLLVGTLALIVLQAFGVGLQWLNEVLHRAGPYVAAQARLPAWVAEGVAFGFHFNLFIFTALAPVLLWLAMNRAQVRAWAQDFN